MRRRISRHGINKPFRISFSDGKQYEVRHPETAMVSRSTAVLGILGPRGPDRPVERIVHCALLHITQTELIDSKPSAD